MANYPKYNLTGKTPAATYQNIVQYNFESSSLVDSLGNDLSSSLNLTASHAVSASWAPDQTVSVNSSSWASQSLSSSTTLNVESDNTVIIRSQDGVSVIATNNVFLSATGAMDMEAAGGNISMYPSASVDVFGDLDVTGTLTKNGVEYVPTHSISASWAPGSGGGTTLVTASTYEITASYSVSASWAPGGGAFNGTASYFDNGNGATINGSGLANLGDIIANAASIPVIGLLSGGGYYQDEVHGRFGFNGRYDDTQPTLYFESSRIEGRKDANSPNFGGALVLMTSDSSGTMTERVKIDKDGNIIVNGFTGLTVTQSFKDGNDVTRIMTITNGLITGIT